MAAAADLKFALDAAVSEFRERAPTSRSGRRTGSSGSFFAQIENGAPFDLFLSADVDYPAKLRAAGLAVDGSEFLYGEGRIVALGAKRLAPTSNAEADAAVRSPDPSVKTRRHRQSRGTRRTAARPRRR